MERLIGKYAAKMVDAGLADSGAPLIGALDADLVWNRDGFPRDILEDVFEGLNINSLLFSKPAEPYRSIIDFLASRSEGVITPEDCETRTFLHDLPVAESFHASSIIRALKRRKCVIVPREGLVTFGTVTPEQAFVTYSSVCFSCFVKFFADLLKELQRRRIDREWENVLNTVLSHLPALCGTPPALTPGPFGSEEEVRRALCEAGRATVRQGLVDSYFGNISYLWNDILYISQTGGSLDELEDCIDSCPLDGSSCAGLTASSELTAHLKIVRDTEVRAILHGHPRFSVILSMDCRKEQCEFRGSCHIRCPERRSVGGIPVVPGEVGTGPFGLCHTAPPVLKGHRGVIVYGHGVFTASAGDFNDAFRHLLDIERACREDCLERIRAHMR